MQFAFDYVNSNPIIFPERYLRAQKRHLKRKIKALFIQEPELSTKVVLLKIIDVLPDVIPTDMMGELCIHIMDCWQLEIIKKEANKELKAL